MESRTSSPPAVSITADGVTIQETKVVGGTLRLSAQDAAYSHLDVEAFHRVVSGEKSSPEISQTSVIVYLLVPITVPCESLAPIEMVWAGADEPSASIMRVLAA